MTYSMRTRPLGRLLLLTPLNAPECGWSRRCKRWQVLGSAEATADGMRTLFRIDPAERRRWPFEAKLLSDEGPPTRDNGPRVSPTRPHSDVENITLHIKESDSQ